MEPEKSDAAAERDRSELRRLSEERDRLAELESVRRRLSTIVRDSNDAITLQDLDGRILAWNRGAERMYGYREAEALGTNVAAIMPEGTEMALDYLRATQEGEGSSSREVVRRTKDGRLVDVWLTTTRIVDDDGRVLVATTERDITERKQREQERQRELMTMERLRGLSSMCVQGRDQRAILDAILDAAIAISAADFGNIQISDLETGALTIAAHRGLPGSEALDVDQRAGTGAVQSTPLIGRSGKVLGMISTCWRLSHQP